MDNKTDAKKIAAGTINDLKVKSDRINDRTAPKNVLDATDRRTTNPKEREILHKYLLA